MARFVPLVAALLAVLLFPALAHAQYTIDVPPPAGLPARAAQETVRRATNVWSPDERILADTTAFPNRAVAFLVGFADASFQSGYTCTGAFIGPRVVLTAAHCLYDKDLPGGWPYNI